MGVQRTKYMYDATCPKCVAGSHISPLLQPDRDAYPYAEGDTLVLGPETFIDWPDQTTICHKGENYTRQPDRPEPVDPASVKVGDVVTVEADDGSWMVRGELCGIDAFVNNPPDALSLALPTKRVFWISLSDATVRILRAAEPEPDEAAVEALVRKLKRIVPENGDWVEWDEVARGLIRDGVEVSNG